jgi:aminopeptidase N
MRSITCSLALALALVAPLAAQSNAERIANDRYTRSHDYDLLHQRIEVRDFDWATTSFTGRVTTTVLALRPGLDSLVLDAGELLDIRQVTDARGRRLRTSSHGDTLVVYLAKPATFRDTVRFRIDYRATIENGHGLTFIQNDGRPHRPQHLWSQGEDSNSHDWFPTYDFPNDKMTWELIATVPPGYTAVSNGRLVSDRRDRRGLRTMHWSQEQPASTYLVSLVVGQLVKIHDSWRGIPVDYYVYREDSARARPLFKITPDVIEVYSRLTGVKYPWAKYAQTTVADFFGGMENVSASTMVDWLPDARAYLDRPWYQQELIPHELAHQWFGDYTTIANWANMWLNEGFAEFMPGAYWEQKLGRHAGDEYFYNEYRQFMLIDEERRMPLASMGSNNVYPKGALVLRMLEQYLGEQRFWAAVNRYLTRHSFGNATTDDFRKAVLDATGENLDWFWDQWIYQGGYPQFSVAAEYDSTARALALTVKQTQTDSAVADSTGFRFSTPSVFRMPVTIRVGTAAGDVVRRVMLDSREQTIRIDSVTGAPTMVVFDDGNTILKTLNFPQPTAWLVTQLERDPDLWNRAWVISQLTARPRDAAAGAALAAAATGSDYPLTRAQASTALSAFPVVTSLPALGAAAHDTSSQVRKAAVGALGSVGGDEAVSIARLAFTADSSYEVRAAALWALVRRDSVNRRSLLVEGLTIPSYRDVIQSTALDAIAGLNDTTFVSQLETMLGVQPRAALTLASLASRGNNRALDALSEHLNDERPYVREWVLGAFRRRMSPELALKRLQLVIGSLRYEDTRKEVVKTLGTLELERGGE